MKRIFEALDFARGPSMKNRFMLAPLTNLQSHADGTLSDEEFDWLTMRARGGFGLVMTCAAHVQAIGQGFPGQLGIWSDRHVEGLARLAAAIRGCGSLAMMQLHHAGLRSPPDLIGASPVSAMDDSKTGARALSTGAVQQVAMDFIAAAGRAERAGFDGVQIHGAHGYLICQFLDGTTNHREDCFGGSLDNRCRLLFDILEGIRAQCRPDFLLGMRLSPERFGMTLDETPGIARRFIDSGLIDQLDLSLWDSFKEPEEASYRGRSLLSYFTELDRGSVRLSAAGKIRTGGDAEQVFSAGVDALTIGRAAILHHDFPERCRDDPFFEPVELPVTPEYLHAEGVSDKFVDYLRNRDGFVVD